MVILPPPGVPAPLVMLPVVLPSPNVQSKVVAVNKKASEVDTLKAKVKELEKEVAELKKKNEDLDKLVAQSY